MEEQQDISKVPKHLQPHVYKKGQSGNPKGRPKGTISLKQYAKKMLEQMEPEEREEFMQGLDKKFIWEMAEGKAENKTDVTTDGQPITFLTNSDLANKNKINARPDGETEGGSA